MPKHIAHQYLIIPALAVLVGASFIAASAFAARTQLMARVAATPTFQGKIQTIDTAQNVINVGMPANGTKGEVSVWFTYPEDAITIDGKKSTEDKLAPFYMIKFNGTLVQSSTGYQVTGVTQLSAVTPKQK